MRFIYDKIDIKKIVMIYLISWTSYIDEGKTWIRLHKPAPPPFPLQYHKRSMDYIVYLRNQVQSIKKLLNS